MKSILILISSAPSSSNACAAFDLATQLRQQGHRVSVFLLQDAVLAALAHTPNAALTPDIDCYALDEDLTLRGFGVHQLAPGVHSAGYSALVELMLERDGKVIGAL